MMKNQYIEPKIEVTSIGTVLMTLDSTTNHDSQIGAPKRRQTPVF